MTSVGEQSIRLHKCKTCKESFKSYSALVKHCIKSHNQIDRCCKPCFRLFPTPQKLSRHNEQTHGGERSKSDLESLQAAESNLPHGSSMKTSWDQNQIDVTSFAFLVAACHSPVRLKQQGYLVSKSQPAPNARIEIKHKGDIFESAPKANGIQMKRRAVAIDCEMVRVTGRRDELIQLSVVCFVTGETLIDTLVKPFGKVTDWRSNCHGITPTIMSVAVATKQTLHGWTSARSELWKHIDENTILIGQSLHHDLDVLRVVHTRVVDSAILTAEAVFGRDAKFRRLWGLQTLCVELLGIEIRQGGTSRKGVHNGLEDAMAARNIVVWCCQNPEALKQWAAEKHSQVLQQEEKRGRKKKKLRQAKLILKSTNNEEYDDDETEAVWSDDEVLRWQDVIDYEMWPKDDF